MISMLKTEELRPSFLVRDTVCRRHGCRPAEKIIPMLPPKPKPRAEDYKPKSRTRNGQVPSLRHYHILRWLAENGEQWVQTDDFLCRWAITKKHLAGILGQLCGCMLIERARNPNKKGNSSVYRIAQRGLDMAEAGLAALQYALHKSRKGNV